MHTNLAICAAVLLVAPIPESAQDPGPQADPHPAAQHLERARDPRAPARPETAPPNAAAMQRGDFVSVQVNVDALGDNILNDAANEPSLAVDPTNPNRMAIGWRQFDTISSDFRQAGRAWSVDGGRTWTNAGVLTPGVFRSDPVLAADAEGAFYYNSLQGDFTCDFFVSDDAGQTWTAPIPAFGGDKLWFTIDRTDGPGRGHIYCAWSPVFGDRIFTRSVDGGQTFSEPQMIPGLPYWGTLTVDDEGILYICGAGNSGFQVARSSDARDAGGAVSFDFSASVDLGGEISFSGAPNPGGLLGQAWIAVDQSGGPAHGTLYLLCSVNPPGPDPLDVRFARSVDGGFTWSPSVRVNDDASGTNAWQWFGTMTVAPNGRIDVVFNDTRNAANPSNPTTSELFYTSSEDGGVTWSENIPVSQPFANNVGYPQQDKLGDYYDMESDLVGAQVAYAATFNGEQDVYSLRIGDYDCNGNGIGDADDLAGGKSLDLNADGIPDECQCIGDLDGNGAIDLADLSGLLGNYGLGDAEPSDGDLDGDGDVDLADLSLLLAGFGRTCP